MRSSTNVIHETAIIHPEAHLGQRNYIGPYAVIGATVSIGDDNWIGPSVIVGSPGQHLDYSLQLDEWSNGVSSPADVIIGSRNVLREFVTIQRPTVDENTSIGDDNYFMTQAHIPHDAHIGDHVTLANSVQIGGHTYVMSHTTIGFGVVVHQRTVIGPFAMVGQGTVAKGIVPAVSKMYGNPGRVRGFNPIDRFRGHFSEDGFVLLDRIVKTSEDPVHAGQEIRSALNKNQMAFGEASLAFNKFFEHVSES